MCAHFLSPEIPVAEIPAKGGGAEKMETYQQLTHPTRRGEIDMRKLILVGICLLLIIGLSAPPGSPAAQSKEIKVGVLVSVTGAFAPAGSLRVYRGIMTAIDMINARGGVAGKYKIKAVEADAQSNPDIAIREAERLISVERVPIIVGVYSSSIGKPLAPICDKNKTVLFITNAISDAILKDRHLQYAFRYNRLGSQSAQVVVEFLNGYYKKLGYTSPSQLKVAVLYEDGPYGVSCGETDKKLVEKFGMKLVFKESYAHDIKDMSSIILKLKASGQDVILHTGYFPDIVLLYRQGREMGLKTAGVLGHGAGYSDYKTLEEALGSNLVNYVYNSDNPSCQILDRKKLTPGAGKLIDEFLGRVKDKYNDPNPTTHYTDGTFHAWCVFNEVMPLALKKYGEVNADTLRKAFLEVDYPPERDPRGWGAKFAPPDHAYAGQNLRAPGTLMQWVDGKEYIVWPKAMQTVDPKLPMPKDSPLAK
jgi:branched-chain amino acid transport system substrate-binding protein